MCDADKDFRMTDVRATRLPPRKARLAFFSRGCMPPARIVAAGRVGLWRTVGVKMGGIKRGSKTEGGDASRSDQGSSSTDCTEVTGGAAISPSAAGVGGEDAVSPWLERSVPPTELSLGGRLPRERV